jgi:PKD repeat protein
MITKRLLLTVSLLATVSLSVFAQEEWCATDQMLQEYHEANPEAKADFEATQNALANFKPKARKSGKIIVPVVIHVIHYNGEGNISEAQIQDGLRILNEDFNKLNADTSTIRPIFQGLSKSMDIEFRLARRDPQGNCTNGITRWNSYLAQGPSNRNEPKNLVQWDPFRYMNIWLVNQFDQGGLLGFAQFPGSGSNRTYGFMQLDSEWGVIGTGFRGTGGRTASHEMGHCFNLFHPFQGGCGSDCRFTGDRVCDVPPQANDLNNQCPNASTCSNDQNGGNSLNPNPFTSNVPDMVENVMGYGLSCIAMMTQGQKDRMYSAFSFYPLLDSLTSPNTAVITGTNNGYIAPTCLPIAEILSFDKFICAGDSITFTEDSYGGPATTYSWSFPGGSPSTSNQAQPRVSYPIEGTYDVVLRVSNSAGTDSIVLNDYVHVAGTNAYSAFNYLESFENATNFTNDWVSISQTAGESFVTEWDRVTFASKSGNASVWLQNFASEYNGGLDQLISPSIKMTDVLNPTITFEVSYRRKNNSSNDLLRFYASTDCGENWISLLSTVPSFYAFDNSTQPTTNFLPTQGSQWQTITIPSNFIPSSIRNSDRVRFMFEVQHGNGNNFYIDDFAITGQAVGLDERTVLEDKLSIYPNPTEDVFNLVYHADEAGQHRIVLRNLVGEEVMAVFNGNLNKQEYKFSIDGSELSKGVYFLTIESNHDRITEKVVIR